VTTVVPATDDAVHLFGRDISYKWIVATVYVSALFLDILDTTIVNVAIPSMGRELHTENAEWVVLGYTLSLAVWIPTSGWLGDRFGTKRTFLWALLAFTLGSLLCGSAQTMGQLIAFRVIQGIGGGMLTPVGLAMLFRAFPPVERARASTIIMIPTLVAPALGPVLGGLIVTKVSWRWIFLVNVVRMAVSARTPPRVNGTIRCRRFRTLRFGAGVDRVRPQRGASSRVDVGHRGDMHGARRGGRSGNGRRRITH
jgi:MFS family permease